MERLFLSLIRLGIGNSIGNINIPISIDWRAMEELASNQGLFAVLVDGIEKIPEGHRPSKPVLLQWIGETLQGYEYRFELYQRTIAELSAWYNNHHYKMMVLKGLACSLDWPKPEHRPCGDIDIWLFGQQKEADAKFAKEKSIEIDKSHHHHTVFYWRDFMVENHYDFINIHHHKSNTALDRVLKELAADDTHYIETFGEKVYVPSPNFHAFFLLRHAMNHFASSEITLRQILDWGFFVKAHGKDVDWDYLVSLFESFGMIQMFNIFNAICVEDLGFDSSFFPSVQFEPSLKDKVFNEVIKPSNCGKEPHGLILRVWFKYRRWMANSWKHKLCYQESMWSAFWSGVWSHLLKPSSI